MNCNSILIGSEDPKRLVEYYTRIFGQPTMSDGGYTGWLLGSGFVAIGPRSEMHRKNMLPAGSTGNTRAADEA